MNKAQFMQELARRLSALPAPELKKSLEYYSEIIDDRIEDGMSEEEAVRALGDMDNIAREAMRDMPEEAAAEGSKEKTAKKPAEKPKKKRGVWKKIALVLTSPVWLPVMAAFWFAAAAFYICLWAAVLCVVVADVACLAGGAAGAVLSCLMFSHQFLTGLFLFGCSLVLFGLGLFFLPLMCRVCRGAGRATAWIFRRRRHSKGGEAR